MTTTTISAAERVRIALAKRDLDRIPTPVIKVIPVHSNRVLQEYYADRPLPTPARAMRDLAEKQGYEVRHGWSRVIRPAGYRESNRHKPEPATRVVTLIGVQVRATGLRAWSTWTVNGSRASHEAALLAAHGMVAPIGYKALMLYLGVRR